VAFFARKVELYFAEQETFCIYMLYCAAYMEAFANNMVGFARNMVGFANYMSAFALIWTPYFGRMKLNKVR